MRRPAPYPATTPAPPRAPEPPSSPLTTIAIVTSFAFVFHSTSRILDVFMRGTHAPLVLTVLCALAVFLSGCWMTFFRTKVAVIYLALTAWMAVGVPFSIWPGAAFENLTGNWFRLLFLCVLIISVTTKLRTVNSLMNMMAAASATAALLGLFRGTMSRDGRLIIYGTNLNNPNDLAFVLVIGVPLWWRYIASAKGWVRKGMGTAALLTVLWCLAKTGSRGALLALATMLAVYLLRLTFAAKLAVGAAAVLAVALALAFLPDYLVQRYFTVGSGGVVTIDDDGPAAGDEPSPGERYQASGTASALTRRRILKDSLVITLQHPVFGVGPNCFAMAQDNLVQGQGFRKGAWVGTHNTYTQFSSECGIPGLLLFVSLLVISIRAVRALQRRLKRDPRPGAQQVYGAAITNEVLLWGTCVFIAFAHVGYSVTPHVIIVMSVVFARAANQEFPGVFAPVMQPMPRFAKT